MWGERMAAVIAAGVALSGCATIVQGAAIPISTEQVQRQGGCHGGGGGGGGFHGSVHRTWIYVPGGVVTEHSSSQPAVEDANNHPPKIDKSYSQPQLPYPDAAQVNGEEGSIVLRVKVGSEGRVRNVKIAKTSGFDDLDNAAIEGVLRYRFVPAQENGETSTEWTDLTVTYQLPRAPAPNAAQPPALPH